MVGVPTVLLGMEEAVLLCAPCPTGHVAVTHEFVAETDDGAASVWRRRLRFFPPRGSPDEDVFSDTAQGEVLATLPLPRAVADVVPPGRDEHDHNLFLLKSAVVDLSELRLAYHRAFLFALLCCESPAGGSCLVLGHGCGMFTQALLHAYPTCRVTGVERDPGVAALGPALFGFSPPPPRFRLVVADGYQVLQSTVHGAFTHVFVDVCEAVGGAAPAGGRTQATPALFAAPSADFRSEDGLQLVRAALSPGGHAVLNVLPAPGAAASPEWRPALRALLDTAARVFGSCPLLLPVADNVVVVCHRCDGERPPCVDPSACPWGAVLLSGLRAAAAAGSPPCTYWREADGVSERANVFH